MRVLVTGGAGYVGSHVCKALAAAGHEPTTYDNLERGHRWAVRWGPLIQGDVRDKETLDTAFERAQPEAVVHMAALAYVGESVEQPKLYREVNVGGSENLLALCETRGVKHLVFSSSCSVYGVPERCPIDESLPIGPISPYGLTKATVEALLRRAASTYGLGSVALRYFNAVGADPEGEIGELHEPETHLVPIAIEAALGHREHVAVFGTDYATPDGTAIRDYVHVSDLADAHVRALDYLAGGGETIALNLASGVGASVREVIAAVAEIIGAPRVVEEPRRDGDPPMLTADASLAREVLGWAPQFTTLPALIASAHAWHAAGRRPA